MGSLRWWQQAVFYQIYPRSFADGNGDGIGDFQGMIARLDYLQALGIDAIWLSPHFPSPFLDCGYDISDYTQVAPEYGALADFKQFLNAAHDRDIRVVLDLVLNHTSDLHPWFLESRSGRENSKRDWYIWHDGRGDDGNDPPNNWASIFGGSSWTHDPQTGQYYYHIVLAEQPDLNWRNPEVKRAMWDAVRFWLDMGVDGFRLDAIATIFEHPDLPNHTLSRAPAEILDANMLSPAEYQELLRFQIRQPGMHELMQELRALIDSYPGDRVLLAEDEDVAYHGTGDNELHLVFNFPLMRTERLAPAHIRANQAERLAALPPGAWPCNTLGNHDSPRVWSRYGDGTHNDALARVHIALMLTLKGTPVLFNGEEIGMADLELTELSQFRDTAALGQYRRLTERFGKPPVESLQMVVATTRDRCRSPLHWSSAPNAGFCPPEVQPWLPVHTNAQHGVNVADQQGNPASLLSFYQRMLALRRRTPALVAGSYEVLDQTHPEVFAFVRHAAHTGQRCVVLLNFAQTSQDIMLNIDTAAKILFASTGRSDHVVAGERVHMEAFEVLVAELI